jgi:hypothetical protein
MHLQHPCSLILILAVALYGTAAAEIGDDHQAVQSPQIVSAAIDPEPLHAGDPVEATVLTTPDIVSVEAHVVHLKFAIPQLEPGKFRQIGHVPKIARFFHGTYHVTFVGRCSDGRTAERSEEIVLN